MSGSVASNFLVFGQKCFLAKNAPLKSEEIVESERVLMGMSKKKSIHENTGFT